jgi:hypothetical protein
MVLMFFRGGFMKKAWVCIGVLMVLHFVGISQSLASRPVGRTITGCVIHGKLYSIHKGVAEATGKKTTAVYLINVRELNLAPYEGRKLRVHGNLLPGDRFTPDPQSIEVLGPCDKQSKRAIAEQSP